MPSFSASSFHSSPPEMKLIPSTELKCSHTTLQYKDPTQDPPNRQNSRFSLTILTFLKSIYSSQYITILQTLKYFYTPLIINYEPCIPLTPPPPPTPYRKLRRQVRRKSRFKRPRYSCPCAHAQLSPIYWKKQVTNSKLIRGDHFMKMIN